MFTAIQSDQSLTHQSPGQDLMQPLDSAERNFPLQSAIQLNRQVHPIAFSLLVYFAVLRVTADLLKSNDCF